MITEKCTSYKNVLLPFSDMNKHPNRLNDSNISGNYYDYIIIILVSNSIISLPWGSYSQVSNNLNLFMTQGLDGKEEKTYILINNQFQSRENR